MIDFLSEIYFNLYNIFSTIQITDIIDIAIVSYLVYKLIFLVRETRAAQLVKGIILLTLSYLIADLFNLKTLNFIFVNVFNIGIMAVLIVFQPELRRALEQVGRAKISRFNIFNSNNQKDTNQQESRNLINSICKAVSSLSKTKTGALIVIERETKLGDIINSGTVLDAAITPELICNIFFPNSPLHDGAIVIKENKLYAAGCFLPLMQRMDSQANYGTRHRAAIGMSENSDSIVVVVSEETGTISLAKSGRLRRGFDIETLRDTLYANLIISKDPVNPTENNPKKKSRKRSKNKANPSNSKNSKNNVSKKPSSPKPKNNQSLSDNSSKNNTSKEN